MADSAPIGDPGVCDTHDHGVTPQRLPALQAEAHAFNHLLLVSEDGHKGPAHRAEVEKANEDFYAFLPVGHDLKGGSFEASKAFYEQVTQLPIGERKKLLELTKSENEELHLHNPSIPQMVLDMDSSAFINALDFQRGAYAYHFAYVGGMCAEVPDFDANNPPGRSGWEIILPTLNLRR
jgi:hypothetical protein